MDRHKAAHLQEFIGQYWKYYQVSYLYFYKFVAGFRKNAKSNW